MPERLTQTLTELERDDWGEPSWDSHLVTAVHQLRRKPIGDFTIEDLRIAIGQNVGLRFLIPLALSRLKLDPLVEGDMYPGDLLMAILRVEGAFWIRHSDLQRRLMSVVDRATELSNDAKILAVIRRFNANHDGGTTSHCQ